MKMLVLLFVTALLLQSTCSNETRHRMRHQGIIVDALRERLGLSEHRALPDLHKVLSNIREEMHSEHERLLHRFTSMGTSAKDSSKEQLGMDEESEQDPYRRIITLALNHLLKNLRTVEGGEEAKRWMETLMETSKSTPKPSKSNGDQKVIALLRNVTQSMSSNEIENSASKR